MGKKKKMKVSVQTKQAPTMDPLLIKSFARGREAGMREGKIEGKIDGMSEMMNLFHEWTEDMDKHVKGVGPVIKQEITLYFANCIKEQIRKQLENKETPQL
jgi:flagellar biosynthesis/type III secretory pathway protein FliH